MEQFLKTLSDMELVAMQNRPRKVDDKDTLDLVLVELREREPSGKAFKKSPTLTGEEALLGTKVVAVEWYGVDKCPNGVCLCLVSIGGVVYPAVWRTINKRFEDVNGKPFRKRIEGWAFVPHSPYSDLTKKDLHQVTLVNQEREGVSE